MTNTTDQDMTDNLTVGFIALVILLIASYYQYDIVVGFQVMTEAWRTAWEIVVTALGWVLDI